jgi:2-dehydro-3-deoxyphosphogluconate aldolase / (4S)-4-hydroxy-2-oxoglutarate aldolase
MILKEKREGKIKLVSKKSIPPFYFSCILSSDSCDVLGTNFVKGLKAPMPWSLIMVTGGVSPDADNIASWIKAGANCVGMGSKLFPKATIAAGDWKAVSDKCRESLAFVAQAQ